MTYCSANFNIMEFEVFHFLGLEITKHYVKYNKNAHLEQNEDGRQDDRTFEFLFIPRRFDFVAQKATFTFDLNWLKSNTCSVIVLKDRGHRPVPGLPPLFLTPPLIVESLNHK